MTHNAPWRKVTNSTSHMHWEMCGPGSRIRTGRGYRWYMCTLECGHTATRTARRLRNKSHIEWSDAPKKVRCHACPSVCRQIPNDVSTSSNSG